LYLYGFILRIYSSKKEMPFANFVDKDEARRLYYKPLFYIVIIGEYGVRKLPPIFPHIPPLSSPRVFYRQKKGEFSFPFKLFNNFF